MHDGLPGQSSARRHRKRSRPKYIPAAHLEIIDDAILELIFDDRGPRCLIVEAPPRHGKSELLSYWFPVWYLARFPDDHVMLTSYADALARNFGRRVRDKLNERRDWFELPGVRTDAKAASDWQIAGYDGGMITAGVGGPITGKGANLFIVDDPIKNAEWAVSDKIRDGQWEWFQSTAWSRIESNGKLVFIMTRWHDDDLVGRFVDKADEFGLDFRRITLPAVATDRVTCDPTGRAVGEPLWPERWSAEALEEKRLGVSEYWWQAMYQQQPGIYGQNAWPEEYFQEPFWCEDLEYPDSFELEVIACDPSRGKKTGDYAGIVHLGLARGLLWVDALVDRWPLTPLVGKIIDHYQAHPQTFRVGLESNAWQDLIGNEVDRVTRERRAAPLPISLIHNSTNKELRIERLAPYLARHHMRFVRTPGNELLVRQLKAFPNGDYDDGPDALEMALRLLTHFHSQRRKAG